MIPIFEVVGISKGMKVCINSYVRGIWIKLETEKNFIFLCIRALAV